MVHRLRRNYAVAAATVLITAISGLVGVQMITPPADAATPPLIYDNFNGTGTVGGSATEDGSKTWQAYNGTWTKNGSGLATTPAGPGANPMLVTDVGTGDVDVRLTTSDSSGEALYFRVKDANNWLRARISRTRNYFTDLQYSYTYTQYWVDHWRKEYRYQDRRYQTEYSTVSYGSWSSWSTFDQSACALSPGNVSIASDTNTAQFRVVNPVSSNCVSGKHKYDKQTRTRPANVLNQWVNQGSSPPSGYTPTGNSRHVDMDSSYWGDPHYAAAGPNNISVQIESRDVWVSSTLENSPLVTPPDVLMGSQTTSSGPQWWTSGDAYSFGSDPCAYQRNNSGKRDVTCALTGVTRQGAQLFYSYNLVLDKSVAGSVSTLANWSLGGSPAAGLRVTADGSTIKAYVGNGTGSLVGTATETAFASQTAHGCGLGGGSTDDPTSALTYCSSQALRNAPTVNNVQITPGGSGYTTSLIPTVSAVLSDPDSGTLSATFSLLKAGQTIWSESDTGVSSGDAASAQLPTNILQFGQTYTLRTEASDGSTTSSADTQTFQVDAAGPIPVSGCASDCTSYPSPVTVVNASLSAGETRDITLSNFVPDAADANSLVLQVSGRTTSGTDASAAVYVSNPDYPRPVAAVVKATTTSATTVNVEVLRSSTGVIRVQNAGTTSQQVVVAVIGRHIWNDSTEQALQADEDAPFASDADVVQLDPQDSFAQSIPAATTSQSELTALFGEGEYTVNAASDQDGTEICGPQDVDGRQLCTQTLSSSTYATELTTSISDETADEAEARQGPPLSGSEFPQKSYADYYRPAGCDGGQVFNADDRHYGCHFENDRAVLRVDGKVTGRAWFTETLRIWTHQRDDTVQFRWDREMTKVTGALEATGVWGSMEHAPDLGSQSVGAYAIHPFENTVADPIWSHEWTDESTLISRAGSPNQTATMANLVVWSLVGPGVPIGRTLAMTSPPIRCDTAGELGGMGCIFPGVTPRFTMYRDGRAPQTAIHVYESIAAGYPSTLTRAKFKIPINRPIAQAMCKADGMGPSCDEYPFASTLEGCETGFCHVKGIPGPDNSMGGTLLSQFYQLNRVKNYERFNVTIH
jgi:hypothetical protein